MCASGVDRLRALGIAPGDRVAVVGPNGPELAIQFLTVAACAGCAPLNPGYRTEEFQFYLSDLGARVLCMPADFDSPARQAATNLGLPVLTPHSTDAVGPPDSSPANGSDHVALLLHTSGTTARPKLVPLTQANLLASAVNVGRSLQLSPTDRSLNIMPLFHIHGLVAALLATLQAGGSLVCAPGFQAPRFLDWLESSGATWYTAVPTMHQAILARVSAPVSPGRLRFIRSSSAALAPSVQAELESVFGCPVIEAYGMTEPPTCNRPSKPHRTHL